MGDRVVASGLYYLLEKEMAPHSSTLAWKILWMEEPGGLQSIGSQKVGYDSSDLACMHVSLAIMPDEFSFV